jgi:hypothetical protein
VLLLLLLKLSNWGLLLLLFIKILRKVSGGGHPGSETRRNQRWDPKSAALATRLRFFSAFSPSVALEA